MAAGHVSKNALYGYCFYINCLHITLLNEMFEVRVIDTNERSGILKDPRT